LTVSNNNPSGLSRPVQIKFRVTESEREMICAKMRLLKTNNLAVYMRKIAINGYVVNVDYSDLKAVAYEMQRIGVNINQIAKRVNSTSRIYEQDFVIIKQGIGSIWQLLRSSPSKPDWR